ncbi:MAG: 2-dehydropantoate 2-reductase [Myxococcales bacterium]|nr:2-dehydropantoate 2-reductase [Myxococcales bacterium]
MKIAVVGVGAMGSVYAGLLAEAGHEVWAIDVWPEHVAAIREHGLRVEGASGDRTVKLSATTDPAEAGACDLVILATKAAGVAPAAQALSPLLGDETPILTIQNGLGAAERLEQHVPSERILIGVAGGFAASMRGPGHAHHHGMELVRLGERAGGITPRLEAVAKVWEEAGFRVKTYDDIDQLVWEKFIVNVTFNGPCTAFLRSAKEVIEDPITWHVAMGCGREAFEAGRAKGVKFSFDDPEDYIERFRKRVPDARPSMLQDHEAGRRSEIDAINGMVPVVAAEVGTDAPYNEVITAVVKAREATFS